MSEFRLIIAGLLFSTPLFAAEPVDHRLVDKPRNLNGYFPFSPPADLKTWNDRRDELKVQLKVALGLWPMPAREPITPTIHGVVDRGDYTVESVFFASMPGHYVTGNLYRPKSGGKHPAVLCPHGHWANGRMYDAGEKAAKGQIAQGAETWVANARYILQARCANLARLGCVVFHYDMVGNADSRAIAHNKGLTDYESLLWLHSHMGLQTWNSLRALDFVCTLPDVDASRIGCTGGSGGGTQTFILAALEDRIAAAFPAVMVSTGMQGGCICENAPYLRLGTGNVEIAALFAPKPLGMTGANDWTIDIETKGLPELKRLYSMFGRSENVSAKCFPQFGHNFNQPSRELMYDWFNTHLKLGNATPIRERELSPILPQELSVFNAAHLRPDDELDMDGLRRVMVEQTKKQQVKLIPRSANGWRDARSPLRLALGAMIHDALPSGNEVTATTSGDVVTGHGFTITKHLISRAGEHEAIPAWLITPKDSIGDIVIYVHPAGKAALIRDGQPTNELKSMLDRQATVLALDVFGTGDLSAGRPKVEIQYAGYTLGYYRTMLAERVHDILTAVTFAKSKAKSNRVHLVGAVAAGPWVVIARALCGDSIARCAADLNGFRFEDVRSTDGPMMLPGALKYGGLAAFAALCAPHDMMLHNHRGTATGVWPPQAYKALNAESRLRRSSERLSIDKVMEWLLAK